jgi:hypothetical protein
VITALVTELEASEPQGRAGAVDRAKEILRGHPDGLGVLGRALYERSFPDCELLGAQVLLEVLRAGSESRSPDSPDPIQGIVSALGYVERIEDVEPVIEEAVRLTQGDLRLRNAWSVWLAGHAFEERGQVVAEEMVARAVDLIETTPDDPEVITSLVSGLERAGSQARSEAVDRVRAMLSGNVEGLVRFGDALRRRSFSGCELFGAQVLLDALRADPLAPGAVDGIASALGYIADRADARSIAEEGLRITANDSRLLSAWHKWLDSSGSTATDAVLARGSAYGRCGCSGTFARRTVEVRLQAFGDTVVLDDVPQGACPSCGSRVYKSNVLAAIEAVTHEKDAAKARRSP